MIVGRDAELEALHAFAAAPAGGLLLEAGPGYGKTTLWRAGVELLRERGVRVLVAAPAERESALAFAGLADLAAGLPAPPAALPPVQRDALAAALRRAPARVPTDRLAVSLALFGWLRAAAGDGAVVLAVDDLPWLDPSTADVLAFVLRRSTGANLHLLATARVGSPSARALAAAADARVMGLGPLRAPDLARLVRERLGLDLGGPAAIRLAERTGGNPLHALELLRALPPGARLRPGEPLPAGGALDGLVRQRIAVLPEPTRELLAGLALAGHPTLELAERLGGGLADAIAADVVRLEGARILFTHPLLAAAAEALLGPEDRRRTHARLAELVGDPDDAALHLARAAPGPAQDVAQRLDAAAERAACRGAPRASAELAELAADLTPQRAVLDRARRLIAAAEQHEAAADAARAQALLERLVQELPAGPPRAAALARLAGVHRDLEAAVAAADQAVAEAGRDAAVASLARLHSGNGRMLMGDVGGYERDTLEAAELAGRAGRPLDRARALGGLGLARFARGRGIQWELGREALALTAAADVEARRREPPTRAANEFALQLLYAGRLDEARQVIQARLNELAEGEDVLEACELNIHLADLEVRAGRWAEAEAAAGAALDAGAVGSNYEGGVHYVRAVVHAHRGRVDAARAGAGAGLRAAEACGDAVVGWLCHHVLGFVALSLGDAAGAHAELSPVLEGVRASGFAEPAIVPVGPDAAEALAALGRVAEAGALAEELVAAGRRLDRPWAIAGGLRGAALAHAARGELASALASAEAAVPAAEAAGDPFSLARARLVHGVVLRRARRQAAARDALSAARDGFARLGAELWAGRAERELGRVGGRRPARPDGLTATEGRVAELVARGRTNKEVAAELFLSVKTVEANLSRVFAKLDVRSRAELAGRFAGGAFRAGSPS